MKRQAVDNMTIDQSEETAKRVELVQVQVGNEQFCAEVESVGGARITPTKDTSRHIVT